MGRTVRACSIEPVEVSKKRSSGPLKRSRFEPDGYREPRLFPQSRRLPVGLPGPYPSPRIHPVDRVGPLRRCVHDQLGIECLSRHFGADVRSPLRARMPSRPRRGRIARAPKGQCQARAGRDLPLEARCRRLQRRHSRTLAESCNAAQRQADRAGRWGTCVVDGCARSRAARLRVRGVRRRQARGRHDAHADSEVPAS